MNSGGTGSMFSSSSSGQEDAALSGPSQWYFSPSMSSWDSSLRKVSLSSSLSSGQNCRTWDCPAFAKPCLTCSKESIMRLGNKANRGVAKSSMHTSKLLLWAGCRSVLTVHRKWLACLGKLVTAANASQRGSCGENTKITRAAAASRVTDTHSLCAASGKLKQISLKIVPRKTEHFVSVSNKLKRLTQCQLTGPPDARSSHLHKLNACSQDRAGSVEIFQNHSF